MRDLAIAYGNSRQAKKWVNKTVKFDDLKERLKVTIRTTESAEEYAKLREAAEGAGSLGEGRSRRSLQQGLLPDSTGTGGIPFGFV